MTIHMTFVKMTKTQQKHVSPHWTVPSFFLFTLLQLNLHSRLCNNVLLPPIVYIHIYYKVGAMTQSSQENL